jgi:hypothetical protein
MASFFCQTSGNNDNAKTTVAEGEQSGVEGLVLRCYTRPYFEDHTHSFKTLNNNTGICLTIVFQNHRQREKGREQCIYLHLQNTTWGLNTTLFNFALKFCFNYLCEIKSLCDTRYKVTTTMTVRDHHIIETEESTQTTERYSMEWSSEGGDQPPLDYTHTQWARTHTHTPELGTFFEYPNSYCSPDGGRFDIVFSFFTHPSSIFIYPLRFTTMSTTIPLSFYPPPTNLRASEGGGETKLC